MKKIMPLFFGACFIQFSLKAQQADSAVALVHYNFSYVIDTTQPESPNTEKMILYLGANSSLYMSYDRILFTKAMKEKLGNPSTGEITSLGNLTSVTVNGVSGNVGTFGGGPGTTVNLGKSGTPGMLIKNNETTKLATFSTSYGKEFFIEEPMPAINWQIGTDTKTIQGLACQKATAHF